MASKDKASKVGINEIAEALGVSKSTVSRALNDHPKISKETKQKVLFQAQQLGYEPNVPNLISNKESHAIALIIPHSKNTFFSEIITSIREICDANKYSLFVCESNYDIGIEKKCIEQIKSLGFQAMIYVAHKDSEKLNDLEYLIKVGFPLTVVHESHLKNAASTVILDVHQSFYDSIQHLKSSGAKNVALVVSEKRNSICQQVTSLYEPMLESEGLNNVKYDIPKSDLESKNVQLIIDNLFSGDNQPDSIIFNSYDMAFRAWHIINDANSVIQKDVRIMSLNSNSLMLNAKPNITYLQLQGVKVGQEVAKLTFKQINKNSKPSTQVFFSRLIIKSSSIRV